MKEILQNSKKILIAVDTDADKDQIVAAITLGHFFKSHEKQVSILLPSDKYTRNIIDTYPTGDLQIIQKAKNDSFVVSLPKDDAIIRDVKWKENNGEIEIFINTEKGTISTKDITLKTRSPQYDCIITLGAKHIEDLGEFYDKNKVSFPKNKIIALSNTKTDYAQFNYTKTINSISAITAEFLNEQFETISEKCATDLLSGILWKTNGLRYITGTTTAQTLGIFERHNADYQTASQKAFMANDLMDISILNTILKNLTVKDQTLAYSVIKNANSKGIKPEKVSSNDWFAFASIKDISHYFVLFEMPKSIVGFVINKNPEDSALKLVPEKYTPKGDRLIAKFEAQDDLETVQTDLLGVISGAEETPNEEGSEEKIENSEVFTDGESDTETDEIPAIPLSPAIEIPEALNLEGDSSFTPPPPIDPLE